MDNKEILNDTTASTFYLDEDKKFEDVILVSELKKEKEKRDLEKKKIEREATHEAIESKEDPILTKVKESIAKKKNEEKLYEENVDIDVDSIPNIFEEKSEENITTEQEKPEKKEKKIKRVDISSITIDRVNELQKEKDLKTALFGNKSSFQVVASQSGYSAKIIPLVNKDIFNILNSNLSRFEYRKEIYKIIYQKILETSFGSFSFDEFLKMTTVEDAETFFYGLYCATFRGKGTLSVECPYCGQENTYNVPNESLIKTINSDLIKEHIKIILSEVNTKEKAKELSLLNKFESFELSDSKLIIEIKTPSLYDSLELLRTTSEKVISSSIMNIDSTLYINRILIPSKDVYIEENNPQRIMKLLENLSIDDTGEIQDIINERKNNFRILYSMKNLSCANPNCKKIIEEVPVNLEDLLFTAIYERIL